MDKFRNKYRIPSARLQHWDYRWAGAYFITICTQHRIHYFGEIENQKMILSHVGILADVFWHEIQNHAQNVELGEFVVMPNHIHGILILTGNVPNPDNNFGTDPATTVETLHATSLLFKGFFLKLIWILKNSEEATQSETVNFVILFKIGRASCRERV